MIVAPKRPLRWMDVIGACFWAIICLPVWLQVMGPIMAMITAVASGTFIVYCLTEAVHYFDQRKFNKWQEENKDYLTDMDQQFKEIYKQIVDTLDKGDENESDRRTEAGNCRQERATERTEKE